MLEMGVAIENVRLSVRGDGVFQFPHLALDSAEIVRPAKALFEYRSAFMKIGNLIEGADLKVGFAGDGTRIGFIDTADQLEKSGFPSAVGADQADFFAGIDLESGVSKYVLRTERFRDAVKLYDHDPRLNKLRGFLRRCDLAGVLEDLDRFVQLTIFVFSRGLDWRRCGVPLIVGRVDSFFCSLSDFQRWFDTRILRFRFLDLFARRCVVLGRGNQQRIPVIQRNQLLHGAGAEGLETNNLAALVVFNCSCDE